MVEGGNGGATVGNGRIMPPAARLARCGNRANRFGPTVIGFISGGAVVGGEVVLLLLGEVVQGMRCKATIGWLPRED